MNDFLLQELESSKDSARFLRQTTLRTKNAVLQKIAALLKANTSDILQANLQDVNRAKGNPNYPASFLDRLTLTPDRIGLMIESLQQVIQLPDPVGEIFDTRKLQNGLELQRVRSPIGVIFMIFEARPNVITEALSLCLKSGNALILRGGRECRQTASVIYSIIEKALEENHFPKRTFWGIENDDDRKIAAFLFKQKKYIDLVVPRGGDKLIDYVVENSLIPIIKNDRGLCHLYLHEDAELSMAKQILLNGKTQRPGVCNSLETLLVNAKIARDFLPALHAELAKKEVEWRCDPRTYAILQGQSKVKPAAGDDFDTEYLDQILNCAIVEDLDAALAHIEKHGSHHSEVIVTSSSSVAERFLAEVDAAATYWNASSRFTDGFEFGLGGELGISTQKLHARGPIGLRELTCLRWLGRGTGQIR